MPIFEYGQKEIDHLKKKDKKLGAAIERIGFIEREVTPDLFTALVESIVSQQISAKAADTVCARLLEKAGEITPERLAGMGALEVQSCGLSMRKASYICETAAAVRGGLVDLQGLHAMPDEEVIKTLVSLKGIGVWTAEMLLIFSMRRVDVVSWGDLAIRRGMMRLYNLQTLDKARFDMYRKRYSPCGSVASLYLWALSHD